MERSYRDDKQHQPQSSRTCYVHSKTLHIKDVQVLYAPTTSYSDEDIHSVYSDVDETLGKPSHYRRMTGDFVMRIG